MSKVLAIVGSYRRGGMTDSAVDAVLEGARMHGAETEKIYLMDRDLRFCHNCRQCTQMGGLQRGKCEQQDGLEALLTQIESADSLVLAAPVNFFNVTALFRMFMERLLGYTYWPWESKLGPVQRSKARTRKAVLITSASMPSLFIPWVTGATRALRLTARILGAKPVGKLWIGAVPAVPQPHLRARTRTHALRMGARLA